jgi:hypothetical protein
MEWRNRRRLHLQRERAIGGNRRSRIAKGGTGAARQGTAVAAKAAIACRYAFDGIRVMRSGREDVEGLGRAVGANACARGATGSANGEGMRGGRDMVGRHG